MFKKEKLIRNLIILVVSMIFGAIILNLVFDPNFEYSKIAKDKKNSDKVVYINE